MSRVLAIGLTLLMATVPASAAYDEDQGVAAQQPAQQPPPAPPQKPQPPQPPPEEPPVYEEAVVVSAARVEQQLLNAPATMSVISADVIQSTPATNYAELLRSPRAR